MAIFYGLDSQNYSSIFQNTITSSTSDGNGLYGTLGQLGLIQKSGYKKLCKSYYAKEENGKDTTISNVDKVKKNQEDKIVADSCVTLKKCVNSLSKMEYTKENDSKIEDEVKEFVNNYNNLLSVAHDSDVNSVTNEAEYLIYYTKANAKTLKHVGITVGSDNKLSVDNSALKNANLSEFKNLFQGSSSFAGRVSSYASSLYTSAVGGKSNLYSQNGSIRVLVNSSLYNSYL